ncbi:MAG TPA: electron transfer flavoprotein subunit beta/FixA family protein [Lentimicrobium sp.]|nr:electron transfer flavoprotein subunit beta/FixA family protein [Lentimicrobium sp.]
MDIYVCVSNVPDTTTRIKYKPGNKEVDFTGVQWIINPWDELALTRALELKEANPGQIGKVITITVGKADVEPTIRKALAVGADEAIRVDAVPEDAFTTASYLSEALSKESYGLILCGVESSDFNGWSVGGMLAELLGVPSVSGVSSLNLDNGKPVVTREIDGGKQQISTPVPCLMVVQKGIAIIPRIPSMRGIMTARTKLLKVVAASPAESLTRLTDYQAPPQKSACKMIDPENIEQLAELLHNEARVI